MATPDEGAKSPLFNPHPRISSIRLTVARPSLVASANALLFFCDRPGSSHDASDLPPERAHAVRFSSNVDEIGPSAMDRPRNDSSATPEQIQALTDCLHGSHLQEQRAQIYAFQPVSLPPSRVRHFFRAGRRPRGDFFFKVFVSAFSPKS
jgi:hypothetical protein